MTLRWLMCAYTLFGFCAWADSDVPPDVLRQWIDGVSIKGARRVDTQPIQASVNPIYLKEGDAEPIDYRFTVEGNGDAAKLLGGFAYMDHPAPGLRWGGVVLQMDGLGRRWRTNAGEWAWNDMSAYRINIGNKNGICVESAYSGLGHSGRMQYVRAVVVLLPDRKNELFYASGYLLGCGSLFSFKDHAALGYLDISSGDDTRGAYKASLIEAIAGRRKTVIRTFQLRAVAHENGSVRIVAHEIATGRRNGSLVK